MTSFLKKSTTKFVKIGGSQFQSYRRGLVPPPQKLHGRRVAEINSGKLAEHTGGSLQ
jgi:hypothetical protein